MAGKELFAGERFRIPTNQLWTVGTESGVVPAFNNVYDVWIDFNSAFNDNGNDNSLAEFINTYAMNSSNMTKNPGDYLALFCSEAVLPSTNIEVSSVRGLRQGIAQGYASYRTFPDVTLTFYSQRDYFTNDVFNAWTEYISPTNIHSTSRSGESTKERMDDIFAYRRMKYPKTYKCNMKITAFTRDVVSKWDRLYKNGYVEVPNSIQYNLMNAFPVSVVASPLAYGDADLLKTTVTFNYETYYTDRTGVLYHSGDSPNTTDELVQNDIKQYGNTVPEGSFNVSNSATTAKRQVEAQIHKDTAVYGDTFPSGSFSITPEAPKSTYRTPRSRRRR